jgi:acid phosphatase
MSLFRNSIVIAGASVLALAACSTTRETSKTAQSASGLEKIEHIVVIYAENRSFDNLYGLFPGADGIRDATPASYLQRDCNGSVLPKLPPVWKQAPHADGSGVPDPAYRENLPNRPFRIDGREGYSMPLDVATRDLVHRFYQHREQIDGGKLDRFAAVSDAGGLTMGYYDGSTLEMWKIAQRYTLADHFFMGAFGGSFLNHFWLICACTPEFRDAGETLRAKLDAQDRLVRAPDSPTSALVGPPRYVLDGPVTPDGFAVNTVQPAYQPSGLPPSGRDDRLADPNEISLPEQHALTIGDTLNQKQISWAWYAGGWSAAVEDGRRPLSERRVIYRTANGAPNFQPHHQPFNFFSTFAPGRDERTEHLKDGAEFVAAIDQGTLPSVAFYKPVGALNEHPGYTDVRSGDRHIADLVAHLERSPQWSSTVVIVTYDENGGFWDHVSPPQSDRWGPGSRIPAIIISPFAKRNHVDHTIYDTTSILKLITRRFDLQPLPGVRSFVGDLTNSLDLGPAGGIPAPHR